MTKEERLTALITNLRQFEPLAQSQFRLEAEDVPIVLEALEAHKFNEGLKKVIYADDRREDKTEA